MNYFPKFRVRKVERKFGINQAFWTCVIFSYFYFYAIHFKIIFSGAGTLLKHYERLYAVESLNELNKTKLTILLEEAFQRRLNPSYIEILEKKFCRAYVTESYSAVAIITNEPDVIGTPYLCKFAVLPDHQGLGAGESLWDAIIQDFPNLFWRSGVQNKINPWYVQYFYHSIIRPVRSAKFR